jgi:hypothetical protein
MWSSFVAGLVARPLRLCDGCSVKPNDIKADFGLNAGKVSQKTKCSYRFFGSGGLGGRAAPHGRFLIFFGFFLSFFLLPFPLYILMILCGTHNIAQRCCKVVD